MSGHAPATDPARGRALADGIPSVGHPVSVCQSARAVILVHVAQTEEAYDLSTGRKVASIAFTGAAAAATVGYGLTPALAATPHWVVKNGTAKYHGAVKGNNKGNTKLVDTTHAVTLTCKKASVSGSVPKSSVVATTSTKLGPLKKANFTSCSFLGVTFKAKLNKAAGIFAHSYAGGVTHGHIKSISAEISGVNITGCKAKVTGTLPAVFKNASHTFVVDSKAAASLTIKSATTACPVIKAGDKAYFQGTFPVTTPKALTVSKT